ncbi:MAG: hypothetical protein IKS85_04970 [Lachnospiraceae bacterium]|nr:hypothetical protein [Lachnospiraceae bacterium]
MTYHEIYRENKRFIIAALTLCLVFSVLAFGGGGAANASMDGQTVAYSYGGSFGKVLAPVVGTGYLAGLDTSWVMIILSASSLGAQAGNGMGLRGFDKLSEYSFGIFESQFVCIFFLVWYGLPLILKAFSKTYPYGVAIENATKKWNGVVMAVLSMSQLIANVEPREVARAAGLDLEKSVQGFTPAGLSVLTQGLGILICFCIMVLTLVVYYLMRYLFVLIDIVMVPVSTMVPFVSFLQVILKFVGVVVLFLLAMFAPVVFFLLFLISLVVAALLFCTAYRASRYFNNVYAKALFRKIFGGYDTEMPLIAKKIPKKVRNLLGDAQVDLVIPVYLQRTIRGAKIMHLFDRWWLASSGGQQILLKPMFGKQDCYRIPLQNVPERKMFLNQFLLYFEIFNLAGSEECLTRVFRNVPKHIHLVFSKEYYHRFHDILRVTGFVDYQQYCAMLRNSVPRNSQGNDLFKKIMRF